MCEQKPSRIWFSRRRKSYLVQYEHLSDMWLSTLEIGTEQHSRRAQVTEIAPKSWPFLRVNKSTIRYLMVIVPAQKVYCENSLGMIHRGAWVPCRKEGDSFTLKKSSFSISFSVSGQYYLQSMAKSYISDLFLNSWANIFAYLAACGMGLLVNFLC